MIVLSDDFDHSPVYFVCYSRKQRLLVEKIEAKLDPRCRRGEMTVWRDVRNLDAWEKYTPVIRDAIRRAAGAIVVFSDDWSVSQYIQDHEWPAIRDRKNQEPGFKIFPLSYHQLAVDDPLREHNFINPRPLQGARSAFRDSVLTRLSELVGEHAKGALRDSGDPAATNDGMDSAPTTSGSEVSTPVPRRELHLVGVPELPETFVEPAELAALAAHVAAANVTAVSGVQGEGGTGKSVLAAAIARRVAHVFADEVHWITVGEHASSEDVRRIQAELLARLTPTTAGRAPRGLSEGAAMLRAALQNRSVLLIVDDIWHPWQARAFDVAATGGRTRVLFTTRFAEALPDGSATTQMSRLSDDEAARFLAGLTREISTAADHLPAILEAAGGLRLALAVFAAAANAEQSWTSVVSRLDGLAARFGVGDDASSAHKALFVALDTLDEDHQRLVLELGAFPADALIPVSLLAQLWSMTGADVLRVVETLVSRDLVSLTRDHVGLHDHVHDFLVLEAETPTSEVHLKLWETAVAKAGQRWAALAEDSGYLWDRLVWHGCRAELNSRALWELASDIAWLAERIRRHGASAAEQDLDQICRSTGLDETAPLSKLRRVLRHGALFEAAGDGRGLSTSLSCWADATGLSTRAQPGLRSGSLPVPGPGLLQTLRGHTSETWGVAFFRDGRRLATCGEDGTARIWDIRTAQPLHTLAGHTRQVWRLAMSGDDRRLATAGADGTVRQWDTATGAAIHTVRPHSGEVWGVAISPDGRRVVSCGDDGTVAVSDSADGAPGLAFASVDAPLWDVACSPDGRTVAAAAGNGTVQVWDCVDGARRMSLEGHRGPVRAVDFSPQGDRIASGGGDHVVRIWDAESGSALGSLTGHTNAVWTVAFSPDGSRVATGSDDGSAKVWHTDSGALSATLIGHSNPVHGVAFNAAGDRLATVSGDGTARIWNVDGVHETGADAPAHGEIHDLMFSADMTRLLTAMGDGTARIWDVDTGEDILTLEGHTGPVWGVDWGRDERIVASASEDRTVRLWDSRSGELLRSLRGHTAPIWDVVLSADGRRVATASDDQTARIWDLDTGRAVSVLDGHGGRVWEVAFSADGRMLATAGDNGAAVIWNSDTGQAQHTLEGHDGSVWDLAFSSDGRWLTTASEDGRARLWDTKTGQLARTFRGHTAQAWGVAISSDDRFIATGGGDGTARIWDIASGACLLTLALACSGPLTWRGDLLAVAAGAHWAIVDLPHDVIDSDVVAPRERTGRNQAVRPRSAR